MEKHLCYTQAGVVKIERNQRGKFMVDKRTLRELARCSQPITCTQCHAGTSAVNSGTAHAFMEMQPMQGDTPVQGMPLVYYCMECYFILTNLNRERGALVCALCHVSQPDLKACGGCQRVYYCCEDHQRAHWRMDGGHKSQCKSEAIERDNVRAAFASKGITRARAPPADGASSSASASVAPAPAKTTFLLFAKRLILLR